MSRQHERNRSARSFRYPSECVLAASLAFAFLVVGAPARAGLTINATFDSSITSDPNAASIEGAINAAIAVVEKDITSSVTVSVDFRKMSGGLGESSTFIQNVSYFDYYNAIKARATSPAQLTALASLGLAPTSESSGNPVNGSTSIFITDPNARLLGFNASPPGGFDGTISLNTSITFPPNPNNGSNYGLQSTAAHEIDEVLGIGGNGSNLSGTGSLPSTIGGLDLYRYSAPGVRSYSNHSAAAPYFSIDGGNTVLTYFNQTVGADFGDWASNPIPAGFQPQVQDAFGRPGTNPALGVNELTALNVIGYQLASVPEPSSLTMLGTAVLIASGFGWSRRNQRAGRTAA